MRVHDVRDLEDPVLEDPERVRHRQHQRGHVFGHRLLEHVEVERAAGVGLQLPDLVAGEVRGGRVRAVRGVGDEDRLAGLPDFASAVADHEDAGELSLRAGGGLQRDARQPRQLDQEPARAATSARALPARPRRARGGAPAAKPGSRAISSFVRGLCFIVQEPSGIEVLVDREVQAREPREVTRDLDLGDLRVSRDLLAQERLGDRDRAGHVERRQRVADLALARALEDERLRPRLGAPRVADGRWPSLRPRRSCGPPRQRRDEAIHLFVLVHLRRRDEKRGGRSFAS